MGKMALIVDKGELKEIMEELMPVIVAGLVAGLREGYTGMGAGGLDAPVTGTPGPVDVSEVNDPTTFTADMGGAELDSEGLPWDARIHADSRLKRKSDNTWKLKRNLVDATVAQVKAELRMVPTPPTATPQPIVTPIPAPPAATQPPVMPGQSEYQALMQAVTNGLDTGRLTMTDVEKACTAVGLDAPRDLATIPELVPQVAAKLGVAL